MHRHPVEHAGQAGLGSEKRAVRAAARTARDSLTPAHRALAAARIRAACLALDRLQQPATVFVYVSTASEVDTYSLIDELAATGHKVLVPRLQARDLMHAVPFPGWASLSRGVLDILTPPPAAAWPGAIDIAFVPGLAFTVDGVRLGYGAGCYDRWLAAHPHTAAIGLAFDAQIVPTLPRDRHDVPLALLITECRAIHTNALIDGHPASL